MKENYKINVEEKDASNFFITIFHGKRNLFTDLEICQYRDEMDYWGYPLTVFKNDGLTGYLCSKLLDKDGLIFETERIIKKYKL